VPPGGGGRRGICGGRPDDAGCGPIFAKDWGLGQFTEIGLGGIFWINDKKYNYTSLEMYLLPNQMIPEHWHVGDPAAGIGVKMESWHVRWGKTYTYGEGKPTAKLSVKVPKSQAKYVTALKETPLEVGQVTGLTKPLEKHWQQAGPAAMAGNVWEWRRDLWDDKYPEGDARNPTGAEKGNGRVLRGGGWVGDARLCRGSCRERIPPTDCAHCLGFRLVCSVMAARTQ